MRLAGLVLEEGPRVRGGLRHARLDDARAEPLELVDPALGLVARLRRASVPDLRRLAEQPDRQPGETRLRDVAPRQHRPERGDVRDRARHRADRVERRAEREDAVRRDQPPPRLEPDDVAGSGGQPDRAAGVGAEREIAETGSQRRGVAARGAAGRPSRVDGVVHGAVPLVRPQHPPRELREVRLADDHGTGVERALDGRRMPLGDVLGVHVRAVRRPDARRVDQILDDQPPSGEWAADRAAQRVVERRDRRVPGIAAHGTAATASSSIRAPGIASAGTPTSVEAGRTSPNTRWRTGLTSGRSSTSVR